MPIELKGELRSLSQREFGQIAYEVTRQAFAIHGEAGRFLCEKSYQGALKHRLGDRAETEFPVCVWYRDFRKDYFIDLLVDGGGLFELKTVANLTDADRGQLLNYLMLTETRHAKLLNFRPPSVEHEFVNTSLSRRDRVAFSVETSRWNPGLKRSRLFQDILMAVLKDWGTGLALPLYQEAAVHFLGGEGRVLSKVDAIIDGVACGREVVPLLNPETAFWLTCARGDERRSFESHIRRFLEHSSLRHIQWADIGLKTVTFETLTK